MLIYLAHNGDVLISCQLSQNVNGVNVVQRNPPINIMVSYSL